LVYPKDGGTAIVR